MKNFKRPHITLKHVFIDEKKQIGLKFYPNVAIQAIIDVNPSIKYDDHFQFHYLENNPINLQLIFTLFKPIAWINGSHFFQKYDRSKSDQITSIESYYNREVKSDWRYAPDSYLKKLETKGYALNTARTYISLFEKFSNHFIDHDLLEIDEQMIQNYLQALHRDKKSDSYINQMLNAIKFYYEIVEGMPNRFYSIVGFNADQK